MDVGRLLARAGMQCLYQRPGQAACMYEEAFGVPMHPALGAKGKLLTMDVGRLLARAAMQLPVSTIRSSCWYDEVFGVQMHPALEAKRRLLKREDFFLLDAKSEILTMDYEGCLLELLCNCLY